MEIRAQVAYHFKIDPSIGRTMPEMITRTIAVGDEIITEKVSSAALSASDRSILLVEIDKQVREATRTARPAGSPAAPVADSEEDEDEMSAF